MVAFIGGSQNPAPPDTGSPALANAPKAIKDAANKYGVPLAVLLGVWGMETGFGSNVKTSSAGAVGDFQFIPSTARSYNYPLTNNPSSAQFAAQADAAAAKLAHDAGPNQDWAQAVTAYGGGYTLKDVTDKANTYTGGGLNLSDIAGSIPGVSQVQAVSNAATGFYDLISNVQTWIRIGEAIAGFVLVYLGLKTLTGAM